MGIVQDAAPPKRRTAEERRKEVIAAAIVEFATNGYHGGSTETIAKMAGISQPYVLRLFGTKKALFLAALGEVTGQIMAIWNRALIEVDPALPPEARLFAIGQYYMELVGNVHALRLTLQAFASAEDPEIRAATHQCLQEMHAWISDRTGAGPLAVQRWFAMGMMLTVSASIGAPDLAGREAWAATFAIPLDPNDP